MVTILKYSLETTEKNMDRGKRNQICGDSSVTNGNILMSTDK